MARDTVAEIKAKLSIQDVVAPYVKLTRAGRSLKGLCPFHKEKTPSFNVSLERGTYHCFGCGEGGDAFSFIQKVEGVDFKGALKILAEKAGVEIVYDPRAKESADRTDRLREALSRTMEFYKSKLVVGGAAYEYALSRGLSKETIATWELGYAPDDWRQLLEYLVGKGYTTQELLAAGLIKEAEGRVGTYYDRFRNRLMFPIKDMAGRTVGFTGRALPSEQGSAGGVSEAKYLNSPETELYHKSEILFGFDRAKESIRTRGFSILVEGQMDLLHMHQAGFSNTVALSGTAFTTDHALLLKRFSENLMLILDADTAGITATAKAALTALAGGMKVKATRLPEGMDPADVLREGTQEFTKRVGEAKPIVEFFLNLLVEREHDAHRLVTSAERTVLPLIHAIKSPMEREHFITVAAHKLSLSAESIRSSLARHKEVREPASDAEKKLLVPARFPHEKRGELLRGIVAVYAGTPLAERVKTEYDRIVEAPLADGVSEAALFEAEATLGEHPEAHAADELLHAFEEAYIREAYQKAVSILRQAEASGDAVRIQAAGRECERLSKRLSKLHTSSS